MANDYDDDYKPSSAIAQVVMAVEQVSQTIRPSETLNLIKKDPTIKRVIAGIGWDLRGFDASPPDLDLCVFLLDKHDQTRIDEDFIFYNNRLGGDGSVRHMGDSRSGAGDGDDEQVELGLATLPFELMRIVFVLSLYNFDMGMETHKFEMVKNVYFRLVNQDTTHEIFRLNIDEDLLASTNQALLLGELERVGSEWIYHAKIEPVKGGLLKIAGDYGIQVVQNVQT